MFAKKVMFRNSVFIAKRFSSCRKQECGCFAPLKGRSDYWNTGDAQDQFALLIRLDQRMECLLKKVAALEEQLESLAKFVLQ